MSHILDIQPHHPHYPPTPGPDSRPSPSASHTSRGRQELLCYTTSLAGWLELFGGGRDAWREGREGVGERGQGCFLFSQLIDSQMSGGVGFVAWG